METTTPECPCTRLYDTKTGEVAGLAYAPGFHHPTGELDYCEPLSD